MPMAPRRNVTVAPAAETNNQLLYSRRDAAAWLGCSVDYLSRMEEKGLITGVRLNPRGANAMIYYRRQDLLDLAQNARSAR
jgi:hypothetical protein